MNPKPLLLLFLFSAFLFTGCSSVTFEGPSSGPLSGDTGVVLLVPFENATNNGSAGVALTEMTASALSAAGISWVSGSIDGEDRPATQFTLEGSVHEYEYKTDLNGDPAVGASATLRNVKTGRVVWQGSASATGMGVSSVSEAGQKVADRLVSGMTGGNFFGF